MNGRPARRRWEPPARTAALRVPGEIRTPGPRIRNPVLYPLSYEDRWNMLGLPGLPGR